MLCFGKLPFAKNVIFLMMFFVLVMVFASFIRTVYVLTFFTFFTFCLYRIFPDRNTGFVLNSPVMLPMIMTLALMLFFFLLASPIALSAFHGFFDGTKIFLISPDPTYQYCLHHHHVDLDNCRVDYSIYIRAALYRFAFSISSSNFWGLEQISDLRALLNEPKHFYFNNVKILDDFHSDALNIMLRYGLVALVSSVSLFVLSVFIWIKFCIKNHVDKNVIIISLIFSITVLMRMLTETFVLSEAVLHFVFVLCLLAQSGLRIAGTMRSKTGPNSVKSSD